MTTNIGRKIMNVLGLGGASALDALETLKARGPALEQNLAQANQTLDTAQGEVAEKQASLDAAQAAYVAEPTEGRAKAIRIARDELELAQLRIRKPQEAVGAAARALDAWRAEVAAAEGKLEQEKRAEYLEDCRERASLEGFNLVAAEPRERLRQALAEVAATAEEITQLWRDANAAAAELSAAGEPTAPLADFHLVASLILEHVEARPGTAAGIRSRFFDFAAVFVGRLDLKHGLQGPVLAHLEKAQESDDPQAIEQLRAALEERTYDAAYIAAHGGDKALPPPVRGFAPWPQASKPEPAASGAEATEPGESASSDDAFDRATAALVGGLKTLVGGAHVEKKDVERSGTAADEHFARIAPPSDHFTRLNS